MLKTYTACTDTLENEELFGSLYARMPRYRRDNIDRMRSPKGKRLSLGAGALLGYALLREGIADHELGYIGNRKPVLKNSPLRFNLSHSGNVVFCAVSDKDVGCDVERIRNIKMRIAERFFFREEYAALAECADNESRTDLFFRYWTLKESFMKVTGLGFELPLSEFCIILGGDGISVRQQVDGRQYFFREYSAFDGYKYAVCLADEPIPDDPVQIVSFDRVGELLCG